MKQYRYVCLFVCVLIMLVGCSQKEHVQTYMDKINISFTKEKSPPLKKSEFETYLTMGIQRNLYYSFRDELNNYIGEKVEYTAIGRLDDEMNWYDIVVYINPTIKSKLPSTYITMELYDGKYDLSIANGTFGSNLKLLEYKDGDYYTSTLLLYQELGYKVWYEGKFDIKKAVKPEGIAFDEKDNIIKSIYNTLEEYLINSGLEVNAQIKVYIQDFSQYDAKTIVLVMPDTKLENGIQINYNLVTGLATDFDIINNNELDLEDKTIFERRSTLFNIVIDTAISSKEIIIP